jgi:hypothetical protein
MNPSDWLAVVGLLGPHPEFPGDPHSVDASQCYPSRKSAVSAGEICLVPGEANAVLVLSAPRIVIVSCPGPLGGLPNRAVLPESPTDAGEPQATRDQEALH